MTTVNQLNSPHTVVIGGGPAGLTAAYCLAKHGLHSIVLEKGDRVGGISRTETY
jgi:protoporphyrinogen oxidase